MNGASILRSPANKEEWEAYHDIRRKILFENRGLVNVYDENRPDEFKEGNYPLILVSDNRVIGVLRVDVEGRAAFFRRVAIVEDLQRQGYGKRMLAQAERFAVEKGCGIIHSSVNPEAVGFYEKCGYSRDRSERPGEKSVPMTKELKQASGRSKP